MRIRIRIPIRIFKTFSLSEKYEIYDYFSFFFLKNSLEFAILPVKKKKKKKKIMPKSGVSKVEKLAAAWKKVS